MSPTNCTPVNTSHTIHSIRKLQYVICKLPNANVAHFTHCALCTYVSYKILFISTQSTLYPLHGYYGVVRANMSGHTSRPDCTVAGMSTVLGIVWDVGGRVGDVDRGILNGD